MCCAIAQMEVPLEMSFATKMRRSFSFILACLFCLQVLAFKQAVQADENFLLLGDFVYDQSESAIAGYSGVGGGVTIPANLTSEDGTSYPVKKIADSAFLGTKLTNPLTAVTLPEGLTTIGARAFSLNKLTTVSLPASVTDIGEEAFANNELSTVDFSLASNLTTISTGAFLNNALTSVDLQANSALTTISARAFEDNYIATLNLPASLNSIGETAFRDNQLSSVNLPDSLTNLASGAFYKNGRYVVLTGETSAAKTDVKMGEFGSIYKVVSLWVKGIDVDTKKEVHSLRELTNDFYQEKPLNELLFAGNTIDMPAPAVEHYSAANIKLTLDGTNSADNPYVIEYKTSTTKPKITGLKPINVKLNEKVDLLKDVKAIDEAGNDITARLKLTPEQVDTSVQGEHKVVYSVTDDAGNTTTETRQILVGVDFMEMETGKGWLNKDFTFNGDTVTGLSESGLEKIKTNPDVVLPSFNPTDEKKVKITTIASEAFSSKGLATIVLPETLTTIGAFALSGNNLTEVNLPATVTTIKNNAFQNNKLTAINLPEKLNEIGERAFENNLITSLKVPTTLKTISDYAFANNKIGALDLGEQLETIASHAFYKNKLEQIKFPESLHTIGENAFRENQLTFIEVPNNVQNLGSGTFADNVLTSYKLSSTLTKIPNYLFYNNKLLNADIPNNISEIGNYAFAKNLVQTLEIPAYVQKLGNHSFEDNYNLKTLKFNEGLVNIDDYAFNNTGLRMDELVMPSTVKSIGSSAFYGGSYTKQIKKLVLNEGLESLGSNAFNHCFIHELTLPSTLKSISSSAFYDNELTDLNIPEGVQSIGDAAFESNKLLSLKLPSTLTSIGNSSFESNQLTEVVLPDSLKEIKYEAFKSNKLKTIKFPVGLEHLGSYSFYENNLTEISFPPLIKEVPICVVAHNKINKYTLAEGTTKIGSAAFQHNALVSAPIPDTVTEIESYAFKENALTELTLPDSVVKIGSESFRNNSLNKLKLSNSLQVIPSEAFAYNNLSELDLPANVQTIENKAFYMNTLTKLKLDLATSKLQTINSEAFGKNNFSEIVLPASLQSLANSAFNENKGAANDAQHRVRVLIKDAQGKNVNPHNLSASSSHTINQLWLIVHKKLKDTDIEIAVPEYRAVEMNKDYTFTAPSSDAYEPVDKLPITVKLETEDKTLDVFYTKKLEYDSTALTIELFHARNGEPDGDNKLGLKEYGRQQSMPLVLLIKGSGDQLNIKDAWITIDLHQEAIDGYIADVEWSSNINEFVSERKFENGFIKLKLKQPISAATRLQLPFYLKFRNGTPNNFVLDLTGRAAISQNNLTLQLSDLTKPIALRSAKTSFYFYKKMNGSSNTYTYYQGEVDNDGYIKRGTEQNIEYSYYISTSSDYADSSTYEIEDELPTYEGKDENGEIKTDLRAKFDPALNPLWKLEGNILKLKAEYSARSLADMPVYKLYLSYPGIKSGAQVANKMKFHALGTSKHTLNGSLSEANAKLKGHNTAFEPEETVTKENTVYGYIQDSKQTATPESPDENPPSPSLYILKRNMSFYGSSELQVLPEQKTKDRYFYYNYRNSAINWFNPEQSVYKYNGSHYDNVFPDTEEYRHAEFLWGVQVALDNANLENPIITDYGLDSRMRYTALQLPTEFKSAKLTLYDEDNAQGNKLLETTVFGDRFEFSEELSEKTKSFKLELQGQMENKNPRSRMTFAFPVYTRLREPNKVLFDPENTDSYARSEANKFYGKVKVEAQLYTNKDKTRKDMEYKDETEYIRVLPWEERVALSKTLEDPDKRRDRNEKLQYQLVLTTSKPLDKALLKFRALDLLPMYVEPVKLELTRNFKANAVNPTYRFEQNFEGTGRTAIIIEADSYNPGGEDMKETKTAFADITAITTTALKTSDSAYFNEAYLTAEGSSVWEIADKSVDYKYFANAKRVLKAEVGFRVLLGSALKGVLYQKAETDLSWNPIASLIKGGQNYQYRLQILNPIDTTAPGLELLDILPYNSDTRLVKNDKDEYVPRGTLLEGINKEGKRATDRASLRGPVTFDQGHEQDYDVFYTTADPSSFKDQDPLQIVNNASIWQTAEQLASDFSKVTAFKIRSKEGKSIAGNSEHNFYVPMQAPANPDYMYDDDHIVNSFAYHVVNGPAFVEANNVDLTLRSKRGAIRLLKYAVGDIHKPAGTRTLLKGATFRLFATAIHNVDATDDLMQLAGKTVLKAPLQFPVNGVMQSEFTSDDKGLIYFDDLPFNRDYILEELTAPAEHQIINKYTHIKGEDMQKAEQQILQVEIENKKINHLEGLFEQKGELEFYKVDMAGQPLAYTGFELEGGPLGPYHVKTRVMSSETGLVRFSNLPLGELYHYILREVSPRNNLQPIEPREIVIKAHNPLQKVVKMNLGQIVNEQANLTVYKLGIFNLHEQDKAKKALESLNKNAGKKLAGVKLQLQDETGNVLQELTTDTEGKVTFKQVPLQKTLYVAEPDVPSGYKSYENTNTQNRLQIRINAKGVITLNNKLSNNNYVVLPNYPERNTNRVDIEKKDEAGTPLSSVEFELYEIMADGSAKLLQSKQTDALGKLSFIDFAILNNDGNLSSEAKTFEIREKTTQVGYVNNFKPFRFKTTIDNLTYHALQVVNPRVKLSLKKTEQDGLTPVKDAEFSLYEGKTATGTPLEVATSDVDGNVIFKYAHFDMQKQYAVKETKIPDGYQEAQPNKVLVIDLPGKSNQPAFAGKLYYEWQNKKLNGSLKILKFTENSLPLANVEFTLTLKGTAETQTKVTDNHGELRFTNLQIGQTYVLTETKTSPGYAIPDNEKDVEIKITDTKEIVRRVVNKPMAGTFTLHKIDENNNALQNVEFNLSRHIAGPIYVPYASAKTDAQGNLSFANLSVGTYRLSETSNKQAKINGKSLNEAGAWLGLEEPEGAYIITVAVDPTSQDNTPKITVQKEGEPEQEKLPLIVTNKRIEPAKAKLVVTKNFNGGTRLNPLPKFQVRLIRKNAEGEVDASVNQVAELNQKTGEANLVMTAEFTDLAYDYYDNTAHVYKKWQYTVEEVLSPEASQLFTPTVAATTYAEQVQALDHTAKFNVLQVAIANTYIQPKTEVTASKIWVNGSAVHPTVWFKLYRQAANSSKEEVPIAEAPIKELVNGMEEVSWQNVTQTNKDGLAYTFSVKEVDANGKDLQLANYVKTENGLQVTNTYVSPMDFSVKAQKVWVNGPANKPTVWFKLYRKISGGQPSEVPTTEAPLKELSSGTTEVLWTNLAKTDNDANNYIYSVKEVDANGLDLVPKNYTKQEEGLTVTNTYIVPKTTVKAKKIWLDLSGKPIKEQDKLPTIYFKLYRQIADGALEAVPDHEAQIKELTAGTTEVSWDNLPATNEQGQAYVYTVDETDKDGKSAVPSGFKQNKQGLEITNRKAVVPPIRVTPSPDPEPKSKSSHKETKRTVMKTGEMPIGQIGICIFWLGLCLALVKDYRKKRTK